MEPRRDSHEPILQYFESETVFLPAT